MNDAFSATLLAIGLLFGMLVFFEVGRRIGKARIVLHPEGLEKGGGTVEAGIYGLLALLIAFTFSGGASRFEGRRNLAIEEANAIGTAYLRIDLLPAAAQPTMRQLFREYLDSRLATVCLKARTGAGSTWWFLRLCYHSPYM